jgi:NADH-quinone oxidoreductase subunit N
LFSLFIKLALAPFHFWSLDVYEGSPTSSTFFFAVLTKLSLFVFLTRLCYTAFFPLIDCWQFYSLWVGVLSVFVGSFGGLKQRKLKTLLAYSSTSHMGYSLLAFSSGHVLGIRMLLFYLIIYMIAGACTWFIILLLRVKRQKVIFKYTKELGDLVLLNKSNAGLALSLALTMFSIAGLPPLIGFFAKMGIFLSLLQFKTYTIPLLVILCSVVSTFYYIRIVKVLYFENLLVGKLYHPLSTNKTIILSFLLLSLVLLFINPNFLFLLVFEVVIESFSVTDEL